MRIEGISTPALIVDEKIYLENARKMKELLCGKSLKLRPHYKSHKCAAIAREQIENGAIGMTCAKLDEAIDLFSRHEEWADRDEDRRGTYEREYTALCEYVSYTAKQRENK